MKTLKVQVTAEDIADGKCGDPERCPIALRLQRAGLKSVSVGDDTVTFDSEQGVEMCAPLPEIAQRFVHTFDCGEAVEPFEFEIEPLVLEPITVPAEAV